MSSKTAFLSLTVVLTLALGGCASPTEESTDDASGAASRSGEPSTVPTAVTIDNWQTHPVITAVDEEVQAVEKLQLRAEPVGGFENCRQGELMRTGYFDDQGALRRIVRVRGSVTFGTEGRDSLYFTADGRLVFGRSERSEEGAASHDRVYFAADVYAAPRWAVRRSAQAGEDILKAKWERVSPNDPYRLRLPSPFNPKFPKETALNAALILCET